MSNPPEVRKIGPVEMAQLVENLQQDNMPWFFVPYPENYDPEDADKFSGDYGWARATDLSIEFDPAGRRRYPKVTYPTVLVSSHWHSRRIVDPADLRWDDTAMRQDYARQIREEANKLLARANEVEQGGPL